MSDEDNEAHWSAAIWSTHIAGIHVSTLLPVVLCFFTPLPIWVPLLWGLISFIVHKSGFNIWHYLLRMRIALGRLLHGPLRSRKKRLTKIKRKMGIL